MRKKQGFKSYGRASRVKVKQRSTPNEFEKWIKDRTIDLSEASRYYKKLWDIWQPLVSAHIRRFSVDYYELDHSFFRNFSGHLRYEHKIKRLPAPQGVDLIAQTLCKTAASLVPRGYDEETEIAITSVSDGPLWPVISLLPDDALNLGKDWTQPPPISDAWKRLGKRPVPNLDPVTLHEWKPGEFEIGIGYDNPLIRATPQYTTDKKSLPKLTIEIEGEPVCLLMRAAYEHGRDDQDFQHAITLWEALTHWLAVRLGIRQPRGGRPSLNQGRRAAFLHDHLGLTWWKVARKVCREKYTDPHHSHDKGCSENLRKQAEQYWKRLRKQVKARLASS